MASTLVCVILAIWYNLQQFSKFVRAGGLLRMAHRRRAMFGMGLGVDELARRLGVATRTTPRAPQQGIAADYPFPLAGVDDTIAALRAIEPTYRSFAVPKKRGGTRTINAPSPELKRVQRLILRRLLAKLRPHDATMAYRKGRSIVTNAQPHVGQRVVIKMDIVEFFPSTTADRVEYYFRRIGWNAEAAALLTKLTTLDGGLPQGAPTSPALSNLINQMMDARIDRFVTARKGAYTRYADDITISFPKDYPKRVRGTMQKVKAVARSFGYRIHVKQKLRVLRRHQQQRVTGLVVNDKVNLTRKQRRLLRAVEHRLRTGGPATMTEAELNGWRSLQKMIETQSRDGKS